MALRMKFLLVVYFATITGLYLSITFGLFSALSDNLTSNQMLVLLIGAAVFYAYLGIFQSLWGVRIKNDDILSIFVLLGALASMLVGLVSIIVAFAWLVLAKESVLMIIDSIRNAGVLSVGLSVLIALGAIATSIQHTIDKMTLEM